MQVESVIHKYLFDPEMQHLEVGIGCDLHVVHGKATGCTVDEIQNLAVACFYALSQALPNLSVADQEDLIQWHRAVTKQVEDSCYHDFTELFAQMDEVRMGILCALSSIPDWRSKLRNLQFDEVTQENIIRSMFPGFTEDEEFLQAVREDLLIPGSDHKWLNSIDKWLVEQGINIEMRQAVIAELNLCLAQNPEDPWDSFALALSKYPNLEVQPLVQMMQESYEELTCFDLADLVGSVSLT